MADIADAKAAYQKLKAVVGANTLRATKRAVDLYVEKAQEYAPKETGHLAESIFSDPVEAGGDAEYEAYVAPHTVYANIEEFGGVITPKDHTYLSWISEWEGRGRVFVREVTVIAHPYMRPAATAVKESMREIFIEVFSEHVVFRLRPRQCHHTQSYSNNCR